MSDQEKLRKNLESLYTSSPPNPQEISNSKKLNKRGRKGLSEERIEMIRKAHGLGMTEEEAAEYVGVSRSTVYRYWGGLGLEPHRKRKLSPQDIEEIGREYEEGKSVSEIAKKYGVSSSTIYRHLKNLELKPHHKRLPEERIEMIRKAHGLGMTEEEAAEYVGVSRSIVYRYWGECEVPKVPAFILFDYVFDTKNNPNEILSIEEIAERINEVTGESYSNSEIRKSVEWAVKTGIYEEVEENGKIKYKAGMPGVMNGKYEELKHSKRFKL